MSMFHKTFFDNKKPIKAKFDVKFERYYDGSDKFARGILCYEVETLLYIVSNY
jgi:hypothetical protein